MLLGSQNLTRLPFILRGSHFQMRVDFGNVTRLRVEMFDGLQQCYAAPTLQLPCHAYIYKKVTWLPVILSKALFHVKYLFVLTFLHFG